VTLFNGDGREYPAEVVATGKRSVVLQVAAAVAADRELGFELVIGSALPKGDRADYLIEKLTELGATRFVPLITARSVVLPKDAKTEKFARMVVEASKQCGRNRLMAVDPPQVWAEFVRRSDVPRTRLVLHAEPGVEPFGLHPDAIRAGVVAAIGPEGGLTAEEVAGAVAVGWRPVSLGPRVLRVETAAVAIAACADVSAGGIGNPDKG
jgi:16S rRNA (uracil1498-N3)-methyltransferase